MNRVGESNKAGSGTTSTTSPGDKSATSSASKAKDPKTLDESAYLAEESRAARAAISQALANFKHHAAGAVDISPIMGRHPWLTLATAAAAGFAAASIVPTKEQQALKKLAELNRLLNPPPPSPSNDHFEKGNGHPPHQRDEGPSLLRTVIRHLINIVAPMISSAVTAAFAPQQPQPIPPTAAEADTSDHVAG